MGYFTVMFKIGQSNCEREGEEKKKKSCKNERAAERKMDEVKQWV